MTQIILNIEDASLVPSLKQILGAIKGVTIDKLISSDTEAEAEKQFIANTITMGYREAQEGVLQGKAFPRSTRWWKSSVQKQNNLHRKSSAAFNALFILFKV